MKYRSRKPRNGGSQNFAPLGIKTRGKEQREIAPLGMCMMSASSKPSKPFDLKSRHGSGTLSHDDFAVLVFLVIETSGKQQSRVAAHQVSGPSRASEERM
jgi:hypothetical protein